MTLPEYQELAAYWRHHPPAHLLLGALFKPKREKRGNLADLFAHFGRQP